MHFDARVVVVLSRPCYRSLSSQCSQKASTLRWFLLDEECAATLCASLIRADSVRVLCCIELDAMPKNLRPNPCFPCVLARVHTRDAQVLFLLASGHRCSIRREQQ